MELKNIFLLTLCLLEFTLSAAPKNIFIAGDSTCDGKANGKIIGWGKFLGDYVTANVNNQAHSGQSARTFYRDGRWNNLIKGVSKGDYVIIQFGHNDGGGPTAAKNRGSVDGTGDKTVTVTVNGAKEVVHTFPWYIKYFANQVKDKGATPLLMSHTPTFTFKNGKVGQAGKFAEYMKMVSNELKIPFIDHYNYIARNWEFLGEKYLREHNWFPNDHTHTSPEGADFNAKMVISAIKCEKIKDLVDVLGKKADTVNYPCYLSKK